MSSSSRSRSSRAGRVAPWGIFSLFIEKTVADSLSPGKGAVLAFDPLASFARSPASGLLRRPAPTAGQVPLAGEAPWPLYVSAVNSYILCSSTRSEDGRVIDMKTGLLVGFRTDPSCPARQALFGKATRRERVWVGRSIRSLIRSRSGLVHKLGKD
jgi:hypothetical protein